MEFSLVFVNVIWIIWCKTVFLNLMFIYHYRAFCNQKIMLFQERKNELTSIVLKRPVAGVQLFEEAALCFECTYETQTLHLLITRQLIATPFPLLDYSQNYSQNYLFVKTQHLGPFDEGNQRMKTSRRLTVYLFKQYFILFFSLLNNCHRPESIINQLCNEKYQSQTLNIPFGK